MAQSVLAINPTSASFIAMSGDAGEVITTFVATMSPPDPPFAGPWSLSGPDAGLFLIDRLTGVCSVGPADVAVGSYHVTVNVGIAVVLPHPTAITLAVTSPIADNAPSGTVLAVATVTMSDGSAFSGTLTSSDTSGFFAISGLHIVTARGLTPADIGTHSTIITATQNGQSMALRFSV